MCGGWIWLMESDLVLKFSGNLTCGVTVEFAPFTTLINCGKANGYARLPFLFVCCDTCPLAFSLAKSFSFRIPLRDLSMSNTLDLFSRSATLIGGFQVCLLLYLPSSFLLFLAVPFRFYMFLSSLFLASLHYYYPFHTFF